MRFLPSASTFPVDCNYDSHTSRNAKQISSTLDMTILRNDSTALTAADMLETLFSSFVEHFMNHSDFFTENPLFVGVCHMERKLSCVNDL